MSSYDALKAEYLLLQGQYEAFDQRALSLKALATPLLGTGIVFGIYEEGRSILAASVAVTASLWLLEAVWKMFQYCFRNRILQLESWFRGEGSGEMTPFQVFASWEIAWRTRSRDPAEWLRILIKPFVCLPYAILMLVGVVAIIRLS